MLRDGNIALFILQYTADLPHPHPLSLLRRGVYSIRLKTAINGA